MGKLKTWQDAYRAGWGNRDRFDRGVSLFISVAALAFLGYILVRYKDFTYMIKEDIPAAPGFFLLVAVYILIFALCSLMLHSLITRKLFLQLFAVFGIAMLPRLILLRLMPYIETGDFANFAESGRMFLRGEYAALAPRFASLPDFMGLSWLNSLTMRIFGATTDGLRLSNCVYSSLSCALIFLIGRRYDVRAGLLGACIYAFYPSSILAAETVGNPIPSAFLLLLSIYLVLLAASVQSRIRFLHAFMGGCIMLLSHYMHPSSLTTILAISFFLLTLLICYIRQPKKFIRILCLHVCFLAGLVGLRAACNGYFDALGLRAELAEKQSDYYIVKLVMGLNPETNGNYSASDVVWCSEQPKETRTRAAFDRIKQRLPTLSSVLKLMDAKIVHTWMVRDTYYSMFFGGLSDAIAEAEDAGQNTDALKTFKVSRTAFARRFILLDFFYVAAIYLAALFGILLRKRTVRETDLLVWVFLGFAGVFLLIESQSRYRYPAMPILCALAGIGVLEICTRLRKGNGLEPAHNIRAAGAIRVTEKNRSVE